MNSPIILVTGASRGIGFAAVEQLAARGAQVILASRDAARAEAAAKKIGAGTTWLQLDIDDPVSVIAAVATITSRHGRLDVLANNSAVLLDHHASIDHLQPETMAATFHTNVIGTLRISQAMRELLRKSPAPRIINVSSGAGQLDGEPEPWAPAYCISKTALNMLTQQLSAAWPDVMVNSMSPGWCRTEMGGDNAPRSAAEGADSLTWLALDAPHSLRARFIKDRQSIPW